MGSGMPVAQKAAVLTPWAHHAWQSQPGQPGVGKTRRGGYASSLQLCGCQRLVGPQGAGRGYPQHQE